MEFEKLFTALVIGGSVIAGGCASKTGTSNANGTAIESKTRQSDIDCAKICTFPSNDQSDRAALCPDPVNGGENCCWLMLQQHECCP
jgi:hypothetical protein